MAEGGDSSPEDLVKNLRAVMLEVIGEPPKKKTDGPPSFLDIFWIALLAGNIVFLARLFPENAKGPLEFAKEFVPWLFGGMFVVVNDWCRDNLLKWSRHPLFRAAEITIFVLGVFTLVGIVPITPSVKPDETGIMFDGGEPVAPDETTWLAIHDHTITLLPGPHDTFGEKRSIPLLWTRLIPAAFNKEDTDWRLLYKVAIDTPEIPEDTTVTLAMEDGRFDDLFLKASNLNKWGLTAVPDNSRELLVQSKGPHKTIDLLLPWGHYCVYYAAACKPESLYVEAASPSHEQNYLRLNACGKRL
jgi:hypothetical protein